MYVVMNLLGHVRTLSLVILAYQDVPKRLKNGPLTAVLSLNRSGNLPTS